MIWHYTNSCKIMQISCHWFGNYKIQKWSEMLPIQVILYMVGLMKFKTQNDLNKKNQNNFQIEIFRVFADRKFAFFFCISTAYTHAKLENGKKTRVSTTSWVFEYFIMYYKNSKGKKPRKFWKPKMYFNFTRV